MRSIAVSDNTFFQSTSNIQVLENNIETNKSDIKDLQAGYRAIEAKLQETYNNLKNQIHSNHIEQERKQNATQKYLIAFLLSMMLNVASNFIRNGGF